MYNEIESEFKAKFDGTDLDFMQEYNNAVSRVAHYPTPDQVNAIKRILSEVLTNYANSKYTNNWGKFARLVAGIVEPIIKYFKFNT